MSPTMFCGGHLPTLTRTGPKVTPGMMYIHILTAVRLMQTSYYIAKCMNLYRAKQKAVSYVTSSQCLTQLSLKNRYQSILHNNIYCWTKERLGVQLLIIVILKFESEQIIQQLGYCSKKIGYHHSLLISQSHCHSTQLPQYRYLQCLVATTCTHI